MDATRRDLIMQRWIEIQHYVLLKWRAEVGVVKSKLARVVHALEWARVRNSLRTRGAAPHTRAWLANAFVAKAVLRIATTVGLVERLVMHMALRRICGFSPYVRLPSEAADASLPALLEGGAQ
jgi:hypothetical protein